MKAKTYTVTLVKDDIPGSWTVLEVPFDVEKTFGAKGRQIQVKGTIDGTPFSKIKLMPSGNNVYRMPINEKIRKAIGKAEGDTVSITMEIDNEDVIYTEPEDFLNALAQHAKAQSFYHTLTPAAKKWFIMSILEAKQESTRNKRIEKALERLAAGKKFHD